MISSFGIVGAFLMVMGLCCWSASMGFLGMFLCMCSALLDGWGAHRREMAQAHRRAAARDTIRSK